MTSKAEHLPVYIDIDGTLTDNPKAGGRAISERIEKVRQLILSGRHVVVWSAVGTEYAREFVATNSLSGATAIGKPDFAVDDNPEIRPRSHFKIYSPEEFFDR